MVLAGSYEECGSLGRYRVRAGARLRVGSVADPDEIARLAETDCSAASTLLGLQVRALEAQPIDWQDLLARELCERADCRLDHWAEHHGLAPETLSRGSPRGIGASQLGSRSPEIQRL